VADNVELDPGTGGATIATDDVAGVHYQYVKLTSGTDQATTAVAAGGGVEANALRVTVASDSTGVLSVDDNGGSLTVDGTVTANLAAGTNNIGDVDVLTVPADPFGANADAAATAGSTGSIQAKLRLMTSQLDAIQTAVQTLDNAISGSEMQVDVVGALPAGNNNVGDVDVASIAAGTNTIGNVGVIPRTSGGLTIFRSLDIDETEEEIKASAGQVFGWYFYNDGAAEVYVKFYNATAANVTVGTTTPVLTIPVPAGAAANVFSSIGVAFGTAITVAATTAVADNDTTAPAANQVVGNVFYS
jgi:hypothetical protein